VVLGNASVLVKPLAHAVLDLRAFHTCSALKALLARPWFRLFGRRDGTIELRTREFGSIVVRPLDSDLSVVRQTLRDREYEIPSRFAAGQINNAYARILARGRLPVIIDAGANIGAAAVWFGKHFPKSAVVAIEPERRNAILARRNTGGNPNIKVVEAAVGANSGFVSVFEPDAQAWAVTTRRSDSGCPVITVEDALALVPQGELLLVKIDIEGFESDLFSTNVGWLDRTAAVVIEPHDWLFSGQGTSHSFQRAMGSRRFDLYIKGENLIFVNSSLRDDVVS
jgi:FkbM family methyltransferase